jgi:flagellar hook assembly protein FlgD
MVLFLFLTASLAYAQDFMRVKMKDGSLQTIPLQSINKITFSGVTFIDDKTAIKWGNIIKTFALLQNYPNPFNPTTTIEYTIPRANVVTVRIYDITGRIVHVFENGLQEAGDHRVLWDGRNNARQLVASGMYIYEIRFEGSVLARKMMLMK